MSSMEAFGGKGKGLVWLAENTDLGFLVPRFNIIDPSYHEEYLYYKEPTKRLEDKCLELAQEFQGESVMVRSSGVLSEDSLKLSGAGMYDSYEIRADKLSPQTILEAVQKVYASVDSPRAKQYRRDNLLGDEEMEVVLQKLAKGYNGVVMSRLPARAGIIPVSWSSIRGAVVDSSNIENASIHTAYFKQNEEYEGLYEIIFQTENAGLRYIDFFEDKFVPLIDKIKQRYGKEFELEFASNLNNEKPEIYAVQIRPLTNIQDKTVEFPQKEPILEAKFCVGIGEYIGPWIIPNDVLDERWIEPNHYAYLASELEKTMPSLWGNISQENAHKNYDLLTPNKKAMIITSENANPSAQALTIANERGIICLLGNKLYQEEYKLSESEKFNRTWVLLNVGKALAYPISLSIPLSEVNPYIHIVSDGLVGRVYQATEQEAQDFERKLMSEVTYQISPVINPRESKKSQPQQAAGHSITKK